MKNKDPRLLGIYQEIRKLRRKLSRVRSELKQAVSKNVIKEFEHSIADLQNQIAWLLLDAGEFKQGLMIYQSLPWHTHGEEKFNGIARALIEMECYDEARRLLERGLKRFPESCCLSVAMGLLHRRLGYEGEALQYFEKALSFEPDNRHAIYDKAIGLSELGYYEDSLSMVRSLLESYPDDPEYLIETGYCTLMMGYPEDAVGYYKKAWDIGYISPAIYGGFCCAYMKMGLKKDALEIAQEGLKVFPDVSAMYENLGETYFEHGWTIEARDVIEEGLKKFPDDERLKAVLDRIEDDTDNPDDPKKPPFLCIMILLALIIDKLRKKNHR
jgi:tetratricopeptide (TPR) repeat protein